MFHHLIPVLLSFLVLPLVQTIIIFDVPSQSITVSLADGSAAVLISQDDILPAWNKFLFTTVNPNQEKTILNIYTGERRLASANKLLGTLYLDSFENGKQSTIEIIAQEDMNREVKISAAVVDDGAVAGFRAADGSWETEITSQSVDRRGYSNLWYTPVTNVTSDLSYINQGFRQLELHTGKKINQNEFRRLAHRDRGSSYPGAVVIRNRDATAYGSMLGSCCSSWRCWVQNTGYLPACDKMDTNEVQDQAYNSWWILQKLRAPAAQSNDQCTEDERTKALSIVVGDVSHGIMLVPVSSVPEASTGYGRFWKF